LNPAAIGDFLSGWGLTSPLTGEVTGLRVILTEKWFNLLVRPDHSNAVAVGFSDFKSARSGRSLMNFVISSSKISLCFP